MFNAFTDAAIDAVQTSKKQFVDTFVTHEGINSALNQFVDSQTKYTKAAVDSSIQTATSLGMLFTSKQFFDEIVNGYKSIIPAYTTNSLSKKAK
jgi:hypothetical protein